MRRSIATPCPIGDLKSYGPENTKDNDTTSNLNFTTNFDASFRNVKPKRRRTTFNFDIHEDEGGRDVGNQKSQSSTLTQPAKRDSIHSAPPAKLPNKSYAAVNQTHSMLPASTGRRSSAIFAPPKRLKSRVSVLPELVSDEELDPRDCDRDLTISRPARRGTIYIPDDTTVPSMYMGIFSPLKAVEESPDDKSQQSHGTAASGHAAESNARQGRRTSSIHMPAKRAPLRPSLKVQQEFTMHTDHFGAATGKENVPPNAPEIDKTSIKLPPKTTSHRQEPLYMPGCRSDQQKKSLMSRISNVNATTASSRQSHRFSYAMDDATNRSAPKKQSEKPAWNAGSQAKSNEPTAVKHASARRMSTTLSRAQVATKERLQISTKANMPQTLGQPLLHRYEFVTEHISHPALYEDDWLRHQELAVTQLINSIYTKSQPAKDTKSSARSLRTTVLRLYDQPNIELLQNRIHAALLYGALSMPPEILGNVRSLRYDIGRRKQFCDFWLNTFNPKPLQVALEVVVGRRLQSDSPQTSKDTQLTCSSKRNDFRSFIETFLVRNEDYSSDAKDLENGVGPCQRTVLRSLMLLKVLDLAKTETSSLLFLPSSVIKSSELALQTLMQMLNSAVGDPIRALRYLGFEVNQEQRPLEEYNYHIENIAVDLRDGVRLTRLVEILLCSSAPKLVNEAQLSETSTIFMPEGETVEICRAQERPLTRHLKLPCLGRATKLWNAQIGLGAIQNCISMRHLTEGITAEDIIDGFREKTMRLLWAIVGKYGLRSLLDMAELKSEIKRLRVAYNSSSYTGIPVEAQEDDIESETSQQLLKEWTKAIARRWNVPIHNFTTSFANGNVFQAILDEYGPYLITHSPHTNVRLSRRLSNLGCSNEFSDLFAHCEKSSTHIFSKDFVLAALAFLCSRLLGPSKFCRSVVIVQRAWRQRWARVIKRRMAHKQQIAQACVEAVNIRQDRTSFGRSPAVATVDSRTDIEDDIWLSLKD